jgi:transposase
MDQFLTDRQREELRKRHRRERDRRIADRIKAVLLRDKGWSYQKIAEALMLDEETVSHHVQEYQEKEKLKPENGGSESKLDAEQTNTLIAHLESMTYVKAEDICAHIKAAYGIQYTRQGITDWLHAHGFSYKKPKETPEKTDSLKQEAFVKEYEKLMNTTCEDEPILFMDSVHPTMATKVSYGWIRRGKDKLIAASASRTRVNLTGAINLESMQVTSQDYEAINGDSVIDFLKKVEGTYPQAPHIHVILDQSGYHKKQEVVEWAKGSRIRLHFLPPYSPNLNPSERLWKVMNEYVRNNRFFTSAKEFREAILDFFRNTWPRIAHLMIDRINDNFAILNPVSSS